MSQETYEGPLVESKLPEKLTEERLELAQKIERLKMFITLNLSFRELSWEHKDLLKHQLKAMLHYEEILVERLTLLNQNK